MKIPINITDNKTVNIMLPMLREINSKPEPKPAFVKKGEIEKKKKIVNQLNKILDFLENY